MAACYWAFFASESAEAAWHDRFSNEPWYTPGMKVAFVVPAGDLGFSVLVFTCAAFVCLALLFFRRLTLGFELGGPEPLKWFSVALLSALWLAYVLLSSASSYGLLG